MLVNFLRVGLLVCVLLIFLIFQSNQPNFLNIEVLIPVFLVLSISFLINSCFLMFFEKLSSKPWVTGCLFAYDALYIFVLALYTGKQASMFISLFLINIILCGILHRKSGAFNLSLWTSILFSGLLLLGAQEAQANVGTAIVVNNLSFFSVAFLGGLLGHQIKHLGKTVGVKEKRIQSLTHFNNLIVENIGTGLLTLSRSAQVTYNNPAAKSLLEEVGEVNGQIVYDYLPQLRDELKKNKPVKGSFNRLEIERKKDRYLQILEVTWSPTYNEENVFDGYVLFLQDITKMKTLEKAMRQQEKMAAVGQLAAGIAHEIRNPLASISGSVQLLTSNNSSLTNDEKKLMGIMTKEVDSLNHLISEFLDYVKPSDVKKESVDINKVLSEVLEMVRFDKSLPKNIKQEAYLEAQDLICGHYGKLKQAFLNIIINAYQSMTGGLENKVKVSTFRKANFVVVEIEDSGEGMEEKLIHRIFEPFHTTKTKGTGLGLAVTYAILEDHQVQIDVRSQKGKGTTFVLKFPMSRAQADIYA